MMWCDFLNTIASICKDKKILLIEEKVKFCFTGALVKHNQQQNITDP